MYKTCWCSHVVHVIKFIGRRRSIHCVKKHWAPSSPNDFHGNFYCVMYCSTFIIIFCFHFYVFHNGAAISVYMVLVQSRIFHFKEKELYLLFVCLFVCFK